MNDILKQWSEKLNGREYGSELTRDEEEELKKQGIVAVFGASDDLCELRGAADDEMDCFDGGVIFIKPNGDVLYSVESTDTYKGLFTPFGMKMVYRGRIKPTFPTKPLILWRTARYTAKVSCSALLIAPPSLQITSVSRL